MPRRVDEKTIRAKRKIARDKVPRGGMQMSSLPKEIIVGYQVTPEGGPRSRVARGNEAIKLHVYDIIIRPLNYANVFIILREGYKLGRAHLQRKVSINQ